MNNICQSCGEEVVEGKESVLNWKEHEGYLMLVLSKEPETLSSNRTCAMHSHCSQRLLVGLLQIEVD